MNKKSKMSKHSSNVNYTENTTRSSGRRYKNEIKVINPTDIQELLIRPGEDRITLSTCHPYRHNYQRYIVYCKRVK